MFARFFTSKIAPQSDNYHTHLYCVGNPIRVYHTNRDVQLVDIYTSLPYPRDIHLTPHTHKDNFKNLKKLRLFQTYNQALCYTNHLHPELENNGFDVCDFSPVIYQISIASQWLTNANAYIVKIDGMSVKVTETDNRKDITLLSVHITHLSSTVNINDEEYCFGNCCVM